MGKYNSSKTRVTPTFRHIIKENEDVKNVKKLNLFFSLLTGNEKGEKPKIDSKIQKYNYDNTEEGISEIKIPPSRDLLIWCINNIDKLNQKEFEKLKDKSGETEIKRYRLYQKDESTKNEALMELKKKIIPEKAWYIFEGDTQPDIYFETKDAIYIGEAKRTENELTTHTTWLNNRDQLVRHIDSVIDNNKKVYSFYIFEDPTQYKDLNKYFENEVYNESLPHRSEEIKNKVKTSYMGYTTWDSIKKLFPEIEYIEEIL